MRYLSLAEALLIAEAVTGLEASTLVRVCQLDLLDSALHAPQAGSGDVDFYPGFVEKAPVLVVRVVRNHPLPDGNKRLGWQALATFCALNGHELHVAADDAVVTMQSIAAGELNEAAVAAWLTDRLDPEPTTQVSAERCAAKRAVQLRVKGRRSSCRHGRDATRHRGSATRRRGDTTLERTADSVRDRALRFACPSVPLEPVPVPCPS